MSFQDNNINIQLPNQTDYIDFYFTHKATGKLAKVLVDMIRRNEDENNYDECVYAILLELCKKMNKDGLFCVSDVAHKINNFFDNAYYRVTVN